MLLGFHVDGKAINSPINIDETISEEPLDTLLEKDNMRGQGIKLYWLKNIYHDLVLSEMSSEAKKIFKTRTFIILLIDLFVFRYFRL